MDQSDIENIDKLVEMYDKSGGFKFSWNRIKAALAAEEVHGFKESPIDHDTGDSHD